MSGTEGIVTIPTELTKTNIGKVMALLEELPRRLVALRTELTDEQYREPLVPGEWSLTQVLAHLIACADVRSQRIYFALLLNEPVVPDVHPQRDWERVLKYGELAFVDLLADFVLHRRVLLAVLESLSEKNWAREILGDKRGQSVYALARNIALHEQDHYNQIEQKLPAFLATLQ